MLYNFLGKVESAPILDTMLKEVVGINAPKIALTRSKEERRDVFYSEVGNTVSFFSAGVAVDRLGHKILNPKKLKLTGDFALKWGVVGRSAALFSTSFALLWAMPFIRNYITAKQTGSTRFTQVIGAQPTANRDSGGNLQAALANYKNKSLLILALGLAGALGSLAIGRLAISQKWASQTLGRWFGNPKHWIHQLTLKDGKFSNFGGLPALLFWGVPAYGGWIQASRDSYERKEQLLKFFNFTACFFGPSLVLKRYYQKKLQALVGTKADLYYNSINPRLQGALRQNALKLWAAKNGFSLLSSILLLSTMPQLINIYLTKRRLARPQVPQQAPVFPQPPFLNGLTPTVPYQTALNPVTLPVKASAGLLPGGMAHQWPGSSAGFHAANAPTAQTALGVVPPSHMPGTFPVQ